MILWSILRKGKRGYNQISVCKIPITLETDNYSVEIAKKKQIFKGINEIA